MQQCGSFICFHYTEDNDISDLWILVGGIHSFLVLAILMVDFMDFNQVKVNLSFINLLNFKCLPLDFNVPKQQIHSV